MSSLDASDVNLDDYVICDECSTALLPDDKYLCAECCFYDEYLSSYIRGTIEASHTRLRVQLEMS